MLSNEEYMQERFPIPLVENTCSFVAHQGKNKGRQCGKASTYERACSTHKREYMDAIGARDFERFVAGEIPLVISFFINGEEIPNDLSVSLSNALPEDFPNEFPKDLPIADTCPVCYTKEVGCILGCRHVICKDCLKKLQERVCPTCRTYIDVSLIKSL